MALSAGADQNQTISPVLNDLQNAVAEIAADIGTAATSDIMIMFDASDNYELKYADAANVAELIAGATVSALSITTLTLGGTAITATAAEINKNDDSTHVMTKGSGVAAAQTYASGVFLNGTIYHTKILVDLTDEVGSTTDLDIIGDTGAASANFGQVTAALNGTIHGGKVTCLEVPAGGVTDIDFYSATEGTGTEDTAITALTETALITAGGAWASGTTKGMTALPAANSYIYIVNGAGGSAGTFSAGKFLIELFGT